MVRVVFDCNTGRLVAVNINLKLNEWLTFVGAVLQMSSYIH